MNENVKSLDDLWCVCVSSKVYENEPPYENCKLVNGKCNDLQKEVCHGTKAECIDFINNEQNCKS